jgi:hypothetical protein
MLGGAFQLTPLQNDQFASNLCVSSPQ